MSNLNQYDEIHRLGSSDDQLIQREIAKGTEAIQENTRRSAEATEETKNAVNGIDNRLALLNLRIDEIDKRQRETDRKAIEAADKASKADKRYTLLITLFSVVAAEGLTILIAWLCR